MNKLIVLLVVVLSLNAFSLHNKHGKDEKPLDDVGVILSSDFGKSPNSVEISVDDYSKWNEFDVIYVDGVKFEITLNDGSTSLTLGQLDDKDLTGKFKQGSKVLIHR
jgi:hypothetical protein